MPGFPSAQAKVGRAARVEGGWAVDVEHRHASGLIEAICLSKCVFATGSGVVQAWCFIIFQRANRGEHVRGRHRVTGRSEENVRMGRS